MNFLRDLAERVLGAASAAAVTAIGGNAVSLWDINGHAVLGVALGAGLLSALKGFAARFVGNPDTAALLRRNAN
ncbi:holin [Allokutzneria sp. A3M-2-11 16]|uniref:holin n=1 Tax=Allokutzneria sp. A3M-2-11 16 TaxID=2962043 RepID=UPI0020B727E7|nr:holin [Allokutzneria sp. A3M-2-11 16]MCP3801868.1 holin [Allokutzneria sp. A3M-2-11 16]